MRQLKQSNKGDFKLISCHTDGSIMMRDFGDEMRCDFFDDRHQSAINCMLISSDKQRLISGGTDGIIKIWCL